MEEGSGFAWYISWLRTSRHSGYACPKSPLKARDQPKSGTCLAVATLPIVKELGVSIAKVESFTSYSFISLGVGCALSAIFARVVGKRPVYLVSGVFGLAGAAWNASGTSYGSLLGSRILYGIGAGAFEALVLASIGDMYYVSGLIHTLRLGRTDSIY